MLYEHKGHPGVIRQVPEKIAESLVTACRRPNADNMKRLRSARLLLGPIAMLLRAFTTFEVWLTFFALRRPAMKRMHLLMHLFDRMMKLLGVVMQLSCPAMKPPGAGDAPLGLRQAGDLRGAPGVLTMAKDF